jgi:O-antigen/teichoic acid export membrane protein
LNSAFWAAFFLAIVLVIGVFLMAPWYAELSTEQQSVTPIIRALTPVFIFMSLSSVLAAQLRRRLDYKTLARRTVLANLISGIVAIVAAFCGFGIWTLVFQLLIFYFVSMLVLWRNEPWRPSAVFSIIALRELFGYSGRITFVKILELLETRGIELIIARFTKVEILGNYSFASKTQQAANQLLAAPLGEASISIFSRHQLNRKYLAELMFSRSVISVALITPIFVFIAVTADKIIPFVFGEKWVGAIITFQVLCVLAGLRSVTYIYIAILQAVGAADAIVRITIMRLLGCIIVLPVLITHFSIEGVAFALLIGQVVVIPVVMSYVKNQLDVGICEMLLVLLRPLFILAISLIVLYSAIGIFNNWMPDIFSFVLSLLLSVTIFCILTIHMVDPVKKMSLAFFQKLQNIFKKAD